MKNNIDVFNKNNDAESLIKLAKTYIYNEDYFNANEVYSFLLRGEKKAIGLIISKAHALKNQHRLDEAIDLLEMSVSVGVYNCRSLHTLASFYRDKKHWMKAEQFIWDIINLDPEYSQLISFATFAADILRKLGYISTAYSILLSSIYFSEFLCLSIPLTTIAIKEELEYEIYSGYSIEVSYRFYDAVYQTSDKYASSSEDSIYTPAWDKVVNYFKDNDVLSVIDIGCGPGQFAEYALKRLPALDYTGFDYSAVAISQAKQREIAGKFIKGNAFSSDMLDPNSENNLYILLEVLEHIEKDVELLSSISSGASVVFSVPNFDSFGHVRFFLDEKEVTDRYGYIFCDLNIERVVLKGYSTIFLGFGKVK
ncbi:class I SAM-dependent methyltransferase [Halomonas sp. hl-4]|uniref:class I SAM-dependent methyltransferase n=1 Tax=Halomonas sp. hl-4 TaxID=1761789 RepID=UPI000BB7885B|nr:class I SAM-dependent methyltransferase [Halomonas sp. hl-4]SNY96748.1 Methyltransferase domain-containing protein [Halomonas sp. hl-4]